LIDLKDNTEIEINVPENLEDNKFGNNNNEEEVVVGQAAKDRRNKICNFLAFGPNH